MQETDALPRRPKAEAISVEDLVHNALRGRLRVPIFQRGIQWNGGDVCDLFDSIFRGYPIGSLLLWRRTISPPGPVQLGPLHVPDPDPHDTLWVVDGQQRVTSLAISLSEVATGDPRFDVWFDPESNHFETRPSGGPPTSWVPLAKLLDATVLGEFLHEWPPGLSQDRELRRRLYDVGKRLREYAVPAYIIEASDERVLREIFRRVNRSGRPLDESAVFNAIVRDADQGKTGLEIVSTPIASMGWGAIEEGAILQAIKAVEGLDPTRAVDRQPRQSDLGRLQGTTARVLPALQQTIVFLRDRAHIPHRRLLPYRTPLTVLAAFFDTHPAPTPRTLRLLVRWVWRGLMSGDHRDDQKTKLRAAVRAARTDSEQGALEGLLAW